ncbi:paralemmin-3 isoform X2 [Anoplopoma fimbria]|nr:paralemmin-3 isoform X2 [Anoplopoma fimbria]XP_054460902.1 paralemmin-3 isoform X2 [Anoplopoma fimbria]XP_054460903.1 paralemmin-3 isoform X2 [Anoplopoma fimbria]XP_054460905.1 paralemmin-3 isoform X2 [Anoplopoma fimbria]XP_054460906.1 paralemmin-3 isoform X2 [Anoplopoma fimbria]
MDETEKYKQRLEAIAEKRRLQEEQDRARRDMEDEKIRLQQLKRKSLRDQWLMEGPPLSPASPEAQGPRSPLWGSQAQEIEKRIDKLQSESQRLAEEEETLKEQMGDGQTEAVIKAEAEAEMVQDAVVQNGDNNGSETTEDEVKTESSPLGETASVLTNGEADANHDIQASTNGPVEASGGVGCMKSEPGLSLAVSEAEPGQVQNVNSNKEEEEEEEEEEEGILVMRAERVIITDEGEDVPEDLTPQQETMQSEEAGHGGGEAVEGEVTTEAAAERFTQPERSDATEPAAEEQPATGDGGSQGDVKTDENGDGERKSEGQDEDSEEPISVQVQSPASAPEVTVVASVPVYSEAQPSALTPELEAEGEAAASPEGAEAALKAQGPATLPGQFQEVPLSDPQENQRTQARPGEQEPLLSQAKANDTQSEPAAAAAAAASTSTEMHSSSRAGQGEEAQAPKHKTCQCCSVM